MALHSSVEMEANGLTITSEAGFSNATARVIAAQEAFPEICEEELDRAAHRAADYLYDAWVAIAPVQTGEYVDSIQKDVIEQGADRVDIVVWNDSDHAPHVEYGTGNKGRGYIYPYEKKFMTFRKPGGTEKEWIRADRVRGQRPQHVARRASAAAREPMLRQFRLAAARAHSKIKAIL